MCKGEGAKLAPTQSCTFTACSPLGGSCGKVVSWIPGPPPCFGHEGEGRAPRPEEVLNAGELGSGRMGLGGEV